MAEKPIDADDIRLFALEASRPFGEAVSQALGVPLSPHEERNFEDGEHKSRPLVSVRDRDVYVLQSLYGDDQESPNDKLCRLLFFIGALKDAGAECVTTVVPYLCYARKDRKTKARDPVTTRYVASLFEAVGTDRVVTMDVHNLAAYQNAFRCRTEHLEARTLFAEHIVAELSGAEVVVVSPDAGGVKRAEIFRRTMGQLLDRTVPMAFLEKQRSGGIVSGGDFVGKVEGRTAILLDDLISTGTTLARGARACRDHGAARIWAAVTHGLFVGDAEDTLAESSLERILVTNTVPPFRLSPGPTREKVTVIDATPLVAEAIRRLHTGGPLAELSEPSASDLA